MIRRNQHESLRTLLIGRLLLTSFMGLVSSPLVSAEDKSTDPSTPSWDVGEINQFLADTESALRPLPADKIMLLAQELESRGLSRAARDLRGQLKPAELAGELLRIGQPAAALEVIATWKQASPRDALALFMEAIALSSQGSFDLAIRSLDQIDPAASTDVRSQATLLRDLTNYRQIHGKPPSADANPWNATFLAGDLSTWAGPIPETERAKLPADLSRNLAKLLRYEPLQGWLWGLLGEALHADGKSQPARVCLSRASSLGYTPRWLIDHRRALEQAEKEKSASLDIALSQRKPPDAAPAEPPSVPAGWKTLFDRPREMIVLAMGVLFAFVVMGLQLRQWIRR
jgi:tetratricopeptide (TPR) repeat protein